MQIITQILAMLAASLFAVGSQQQLQPADGYTSTNVTNGGTIVGTVTYDGPKPAKKQIDVATKEEVCHTEPIYSEKLVVSDDNEVRWAVVSITNINTGKPFPSTDDPEKQPTLDQNGCKFSPHVVVVPKQKPLTILNSDGVLHNVHTWPKKNRSKNIAMPGVFKEMKLKFRRSETIRVSCDIHPWMEAWIVVSETPYTAVTNEKGTFKLTDVPPGQYTLRMWHESFGSVEQTITVTTGEETHVDFALTKKDRLQEGRNNGR